MAGTHIPAGRTGGYALHYEVGGIRVKIARFRGFICLAAAAFFAAACAGIVRAGPPAAVHVLPYEVSPGDIALLRLDKANLKDTAGVAVVFEQRPASIVRLVDPNTIEVVVPDLTPGDARVIVSRNGDVVGEGKAAILPAPMVRVFLRMEGDSVSVARTRPYNGHYDPRAERGRRLSYDLVTQDGELLYTSAVRHPATDAFEVYGAADSLRGRRLPAVAPYFFAIKIPFTQGPAVLRIYEAAEGADLDSAEGRASRRLMREIEMGARR